MALEGAQGQKLGLKHQGGLPGGGSAWAESWRMRREGTQEGRGAETKEGGERREPERQRVGKTESEEEFEERGQI